MHVEEGRATKPWGPTGGIYRHLEQYIYSMPTCHLCGKETVSFRAVGRGRTAVGSLVANFNPQVSMSDGL